MNEFYSGESPILSPCIESAATEHWNIVVYSKIKMLNYSAGFLLQKQKHMSILEKITSVQN